MECKVWPEVDEEKAGATGVEEEDGSEVAITVEDVVEVGDGRDEDGS